jgi:hypothetical protein
MPRSCLGFQAQKWSGALMLTPTFSTTTIPTHFSCAINVDSNTPDFYRLQQYQKVNKKQSWESGTLISKYTRCNLQHKLG